MQDRQEDRDKAPFVTDYCGLIAQMEKGPEGQKKAKEYACREEYQRMLRGHYRKKHPTLPLGPPDEVVRDFYGWWFARPQYFESWKRNWLQRKTRFRLWLIGGLDLYLKERFSQIKRGGRIKPLPEDYVPPCEAIEYDDMVFITETFALCRDALQSAEAICRDEGMTAHWDLLMRHVCRDEPYATIVPDHDLTTGQAPSMVRTAGQRVLKALETYLLDEGMPPGSLKQTLGEMLAKLSGLREKGALAAQGAPREFGAGDGDDLTADAVTKLLNLGVDSGAKTVTQLIERLRACGARARPWLEEALAGLPSLKSASAASELLAGTAAPARLESIKEECKRIHKNAASTDLALPAIAGYLLSIAAGLAHHGKLLSKMPRTEIEDALIDLSEVVPEPWKDLLLRAVDRLPGAGE